MKRHFIIHIFTCILLAGCSEKYDEGLELRPTLTPRYMEVTPNAFSFPSQASSDVLQVTSVETPWKIENGIDWISTSPSSGSQSASVNVCVAENKSGDDVRTGIFYLKDDVSDWEYEVPISVTQLGTTPTISLSRSEVELTGATQTEVITVTANCSWTASSSDDWLTVSQEDNSITLTASGNDSESHRTAIVSVVHSEIYNVSQIITVRQAPASINASTETLVFNNAASSVDVTINAEASWTASTSAGWIEVSPTSGGPGNSTMEVQVSPNESTSERTGYVNLSIGGCLRIQIPVRQRGIYLETEQLSLSFMAAGGSLNLSVLSNTNWTISSVSSWITVSPNQGEGDETVKVTASENPFTTSRSGVIHLTQTGLTVDVAVTVSQAGKTFEVNTTVLNFEDKSSSQDITIRTDGTWTASSADSWITLSPTTASGNSTLSVTVSENTSDDERSGQVEIVMADKSATINVVQQGKYFTVSSSTLTYTSKGGAIDVYISTNDSWTAKVEEESTWLTLSKTSGSGNVDVRVTAADNPSVNKRTATLIFETTHSRKVRVVVSQEARYLRVDTREILFYSKGGTSEAITVDTDGTYDITCSDSWLSVTRTGNTFTVTATENKEQPRTGSITITLTDLKEGTYSLTLAVTQLNKGGSFLKKDYDEDHNWDDKSHSTGSLTITEYGSDNNYDSIAARGITLSVSGYQSDKNWDSNTNSGVTISVTGYNPDKNFDSQTKSSSSVSKKDYDSDNNWQ